MPRRSPSDEIRDAAGSLMQLAESAKACDPLPWRYGLTGTARLAPVSNGRSDLVCAAEPGTAQYLVAVHPDFGMAVARWLEADADDAERLPLSLPLALAVARALGGADR